MASGTFWLEILASKWHRQGYYYFCAVRLYDRGIEAPAWDIARGYWRILTQG